MKYALVVLILVAQWANAAPREVDEYHWADVDRVVAIGDLHGDFDNYMAVLQAAELVNARGKWIAGATHLVQTGDIPDRGPDTVRIIQHMGKLAREARKKGGRVHNLMGNHEAMNVYGDLRYVTAGEYAAFVTRGSQSLRDRYFEVLLQSLEARDPAAFAALPADFREQWEKEHPLGWVEHRQAWDPAWNPEGEYVKWVMDTKVAIQINDMVFLHGGISGQYCRNSLASLTDMVQHSLFNYDPRSPGILEDEYGPLWYRGLSGVAPEAAPETVAAILEQRGASHIVVGHTPTNGVIWPRYDGRVIQIDTGIGKAYGGHIAYLEATPEGLFAGYRSGKVPLPAADDQRAAYLEQVIELAPGNPRLEQRLQEMQALPEGQSAAEAEAAAGSPPPGTVAEGAASGPVMPICGISQ